MARVLVLFDAEKGIGYGVDIEVGEMVQFQPLSYCNVPFHCMCWYNFDHVVEYYTMTFKKRIWKCKYDKLDHMDISVSPWCYSGFHHTR